MPFNREDLPSRAQLVVATLVAIEQLGGSASIEEIEQRVAEILDLPDEAWDIRYANKQHLCVLRHLLGFARWYPKRDGLLEKTDSGLYGLTQKGWDFLRSPQAGHEAAATELIRRINVSVRNAPEPQDPPEAVSDTPDTPEENPEVDQETDGQCEAMLRGLHEILDDRLMEWFAAYLLRLNGVEFERVGGGPHDGGIDAFGIAWLSPVIATTVAVQAKRHDPTSTLPREKISQFQGDCTSHHAEHGILITLGRVSGPAIRQARNGRPFITLLYGSKLCQLICDHRAEVELWLRDNTGRTDFRLCDGDEAAPPGEVRPQDDEPKNFKPLGPARVTGSNEPLVRPKIESRGR